MKGFESRQSLSFSHVDVDDAFQFINNIIAERRLKTTGRGGVPYHYTTTTWCFMYIILSQRRAYIQQVGVV